MKYKDYYATMGVPRTATEAEIKTAHRKLARKFHPDLNKEPSAEARFKEVGEAYQVLKDPEKRAAFDALGANLKDGDEIRPQSPMSEGFEYRGAGNGPDADDFFSDLFGTRQHAPRHARTHDWPGEDHHAKISVSLDDTYTGAQRTFTLQMPVVDAHGTCLASNADAGCIDTQGHPRRPAVAARRTGRRGERQRRCRRSLSGSHGGKAPAIQR